MMNRSFACFLLFVITAAPLSACVSRTSPAAQIYYYTLDYAPPKIAVKAKQPVILRVDRFSVSPPFNSPRMYYADKGMHRNSYAHFQWVSSPDTLLAFFLARDLGAMQAFKCVLPPDASGSPTHIIAGWVEEFIENDTATRPLASLRLHITLVSARELDPVKRIVYQKTYHAQSPCEKTTAASMAEAMSMAVAELSARIGEDIYAVLARTHNP